MKAIPLPKDVIEYLEQNTSLSGQGNNELDIYQISRIMGIGHGSAGWIVNRLLWSKTIKSRFANNGKKVYSSNVQGKTVHQLIEETADDRYERRDGEFTAAECSAQWGVATSTARRRLERLVLDGKLESRMARERGKPGTLLYYKKVGDVKR